MQPGAGPAASKIAPLPIAPRCLGRIRGEDFAITSSDDGVRHLDMPRAAQPPYSRTSRPPQPVLLAHAPALMSVPSAVPLRSANTPQDWGCLACFPILEPRKRRNARLTCHQFAGPDCALQLLSFAGPHRHRRVPNRSTARTSDSRRLGWLGQSDTGAAVNGYARCLHTGTKLLSLPA